MTNAVIDVPGDKCLNCVCESPRPASDWPHSVDNVLKWGNIIEPTGSALADALKGPGMPYEMEVIAVIQ